MMMYRFGLSTLRVVYKIAVKSLYNYAAKTNYQNWVHNAKNYLTAEY